MIAYNSEPKLHKRVIKSGGNHMDHFKTQMKIGKNFNDLSPNTSFRLSLLFTFSPKNFVMMRNNDLNMTVYHA